MKGFSQYDCLGGTPAGAKPFCEDHNLFSLYELSCSENLSSYSKSGFHSKATLSLILALLFKTMENKKHDMY